MTDQGLMGSLDKTFRPYSKPVNIDRNWDKTRTLYFIRSGPYLKIGISWDAKRRLNDFRAGNPHEARIAAQRQIPGALALQVEKRVHAALACFRHDGEWFFVKTQVATKIAEPIVDHAWEEIERIKDDLQARWLADEEAEELEAQRRRNLAANALNPDVVVFRRTPRPRS